jgi:two-component system response regulator YesN
MLKPVEPAHVSERIMRLFNRSGESNGCNYFIRSFEKEFDKDISAFTTRVRKAIDFIWKNHESYYIREEVATHLNVTEDYLCKLIKHDSGLGLNECISKMRILASKELISRNPEKKIREIAVAVGISDVNYFCRIFKKYNSLTPGRYRASVSS